jgi:8-oxo-dGTP pyrophosphatase MutT (NUDIX family)
MTPDASSGRLHADASALLREWRGWDDAQEALRQDYVAFLADHEDAMWRACVPGHLTASTLVLDPTLRRVLLTLHPKFGLWLQMGGHCEPHDATVRDAALREATEESGIVGLDLSSEPLRLDRHRVGCHGGSWHYDVQYAAIAPAGAEPVISDESLDLRWWPVDALPEQTDDALRRLVASATPHVRPRSGRTPGT